MSAPGGLAPRRRRRDALPRVLPLIAATVLGLGLALDRWVIGGPVEVAAPTAVRATGAATADRFAALFGQGIAHLRDGAAAPAAAAFEAARRLDPHVPEVHVNLGFARLAMARPGEAAAAFETAIELRPGQANAYFGLAEARERAGDLESALGAMRTYVHLTPEDDPFQRRARAAIWEWEVALGRPSADAATPPLALGRDEPRPDTEQSPDAAGLFAATLERLDGGAASLTPYAGKTIVLNVWATWCPPCRAELPSLQRLSGRLDPARFVVVGLSIDEDPDYVREFLREAGVAYPNFLDRAGAVSAGLLAVDSYPQTLLIRADGGIGERIVGARAWDEDAMLDKIAAVR